MLNASFYSTSMRSKRISFSDLAKPSVLKLPVYQAGKPIEVVAREFGLDPDGMVKLASNENPLGASPMALEAVRDFLNKAHYYPDGGCYELRNKLAEKLELEPSQFVFGNGSNEVIELVGHAFIDKGDEVVMSAGDFIVYKLVSLLFEAVPVEVPLVNFSHDLDAMRAAISEKTKCVFLSRPINPMGTVCNGDALIEFAKSLPDHVLFGFDEAYVEYLDKSVDLRPLIAEGRKIVCFRTFSKIYGLAGFRVGYCYGSNELMGILNQVREPFNVNAIAQVAATAALDDSEFVNRSREVNAAGQVQLAAFFEEQGIEFVPSYGNFVLVRTGDGIRVFEELQKLGIIVRPMGGDAMTDWIRISIGTELENKMFCKALLDVLS